MGKPKTKQAKFKKGQSSALDTNGLPSFDESTLSSLTNKIEKGFRNSATSKSDPLANRSFLPLKESKESAKMQQRAKRSPQTSLTGRKRDAEGNVKEEVRDDPTPRKTAKFQNKKRQAYTRDILMQEILALGGDEGDLNLVASIESSEEVNEGAAQLSPVDAKFTKELSNFVAGLGINDMISRRSQEPESSEDEIQDGKDTDSNVTPTHLPGRSIKMLNTSFAHNDRTAGPHKRELNRLMLEARPDWHAAMLPKLPDPELSGIAVRPETIVELKRHAYSLLEMDSNLYASKHLSSTSSHRFLSTIMSSGTVSDKISALTLVVQESPVHTAKSFESLLGLAKKRSRGQAMTALAAIKDLLGVGVMLPGNRRLRSFENQPGLLGTLQANSALYWNSGDALPEPMVNSHLISWAYEDWLKSTYFEVLKVLEGWCDDEVAFARARAVTYVYELLREKPEQEANLLRLLVNKLGDPDRKIASRTSFLILQLHVAHPLMKPIIIQSIENQLLLRPGQSSHAKYYAINTLNQTILSGNEEDVARRLLSVYFDLFVVLLKGPDTQMMTSRPVVNRKGQIQGGGGQMGKKAKEKAQRQEIAKRISQETTEKLISAVLTGVNRALPFARSDDQTIEKHMNVLFKITHSSNFNTSIQALMLIQQLAISKHLAEDRFYRTLYESLLDPRLITSSKHALYLNLLFRALKADHNLKRVKAFSKRLIQVLTLHQPPFICGVLYLLKELESTFSGLKSLVQDAEDGDDVDETFLDVPEDSPEGASLGQSPRPTIVQPDSTSVTKTRLSSYDGRRRDPEHSNADRSCLWELIPFMTHFHPSVSMFASRLFGGSEIPAKPELASHTLIHFLDRFVYRNPKAPHNGLRGSSLMQPLAGGEHQHILVTNRLSHQKIEPLNSESFWRKKAEDVAVDEVFFHTYFNRIGKGKRSPRKQKPLEDLEDLDNQADGSENEDEVWQALVESQPDVEGPSDDGSDLDMLDLGDSEDNSFGTDDSDVESEGEVEGSLMSESSDMFLNNDKNTPSETDRLFRQELEHGHHEAVASEYNKSNKARRAKLKSLPTFASMEEYAKMMEDDDGEE